MCVCIIVLPCSNRIFVWLNFKILGSAAKLFAPQPDLKQQNFHPSSKNLSSLPVLLNNLRRNDWIRYTVGIMLLLLLLHLDAKY